MPPLPPADLPLTSYASSPSKEQMGEEETSVVCKCTPLPRLLLAGGGDNGVRGKPMSRGRG